MVMRVLVVEDDADFGDVLCAMIQKSGHIFVWAKNAEEGSVLFEKEPADLVIVDYRMPGESGLEVARRIKVVSPEVPVFLLSGFLTEEVRSLAQRAGVDRVLSKPISYNDFQSEIESCRLAT